MKLRSKIFLVVLAIATICSSVYINHIAAQPKEENLLANDTGFYVLDEEGNATFYEYDHTIYTEPKAKTYLVVLNDENNEQEVLAEFDSFDKADEAVEMRKQMSTFNDDNNDIQIMADNRLKSGDNLIAKLRGYFEYTEVLTGRSGYAHGSSSSDAAYIKTIDENTIRIKLAGVVMDVPSANVTLVPFTDKELVSYYKINNDRLYHYYTYNQNNTSSQQVGYKLDYLEKDTKYYSYDGHYFYTDYKTMLQDYRNDTYENAVNSTNPYYNYYQYLSFRTQTNFLAEQLNQYITDTKGEDTISKLKDSAKDFIEAQNTYGANAGLMFGIGINESAWGLSNFALERNNLFGHNAVDSNPDNATTYKTVLDCINTHAYNYISKGYLDGGDSRYRGSHLGDKQSGMNVKYASDAYWGEKAAAHNYIMNNKFDKIDYGKWQIGIIHGDHWFYKEPNESSLKIYSSGAVGNGSASKIYDFPIAILETITDNTGNKWYKILSDTVLNEDRTKKDYAGKFDTSRDYVYIKADNVTIVDYIGEKEPEVPIYKKGDVDGDGIISAVDYSLIKNSIMGIRTLNDDEQKRADVDNDGTISAVDYSMIKNHIMGIKEIV